MYPIALNLANIPILLIGDGELADRRRQALLAAGATRLNVRQAWSPEDMADTSIVMVAGLPRAEAERIAQAARNAGKLVNVEDINDLCDFYFTANVVRGDLVIAVSTSGASPTLARKIRDAIGQMFGEEWAGRLREMGERRREWKAQGMGMRELIRCAEGYLEEKGWLAFPSPCRGEGRGGGLSNTQNVELAPSPLATLATLPPAGRGDKRGEAA